MIRMNRLTHFSTMNNNTYVTINFTVNLTINFRTNYTPKLIEKL